MVLVPTPSMTSARVMSPMWKTNAGSPRDPSTAAPPARASSPDVVIHTYGRVLARGMGLSFDHLSIVLAAFLRSVAPDHDITQVARAARRWGRPGAVGSVSDGLVHDPDPVV